MLTRLTSPFKEFGPLAGFLYIVDRILSHFTPRARVYAYELMVQPIRDGALLPLRALKVYESRHICRGDPQLAAMPIPAEVIDSRFEQGAMCLGTFKNEAFVGYIWFSFGSYDEDEVRCRYRLSPRAESVFDFDLYVFPDYRLGLSFIAIWQNAITFLRSRGIHYSFSRLTAFNLASKRAHNHLGWKRVARVVFLKLWRIELMVAGVRPFVTLSVGSYRPKLDLRADVLGDSTPAEREAAPQSRSA